MKPVCVAVALTLLLWHTADCHQLDQKIAGGGGEPPATLVQGLGSLHHPVATSRPEAQQFFDQGLMGALASQNLALDAAFVRQEFESAWQHADTQLRVEDL